MAQTEKMKPGFKFFGLSVAVALTCSLCGIHESSATGSLNTLQAVGLLGALTAFPGHHAFPPMFQKRLGSPTPQIGGPPASFEDDDSDEDEDDVGSQPRIEPHITTMNRDQCLAKLLCGMSVPVTGGSSKKTYYNEYANIVSKFFEAFPLDEEYQSKESIETYDDYSNEEEKPTRMNSRRKPLNSSRVEATAPTLQLFDLALVDVAKPEDLAGKNRTKKDAIEKVSTGNRIARARRLVENLGQKLQTVRQCQAIAGCPFTFKQLREKIKKKEAQRVATNQASSPFQPPKPKVSYKPVSQPNKPTSKPEPLQVEPLFSNDQPIFPYKDTNKGDDELEELFGSPSISKRPLGYHQGVDENFNYEYNPDKPWRPNGGANNYGQRPWKSKPRPVNPHSGQNANQQQWPRPRPKPGAVNAAGKKQASSPSPVNRRPQAPPAAPKPVANKPPVAQANLSAFPKKKINYLNSPYHAPSGSSEDDEGHEDINKVAPVELIGNADAGESEPAKPSTTEKPEYDDDESPSSNKKNNNDDSDEYDDDYYDDDYEDDEDDQDDEDANDDDEYSDEEDEEKKSDKKKKKKKNKNRKHESFDTAPTLIEVKTRIKPNPDFDDEHDNDILTKLNFVTTGANQKTPEKVEKEEKPKKESEQTNDDTSDEDDDEDEREDEARKGSLAAMRQKIRTSSTSASTEDDDEVDDENMSKKPKSKSRKRTKPKSDKDETTPAKEETKESGKGKKSKKKSQSKKHSSEEDKEGGLTAWRKQQIMQIGGRPVAPRPENEQANAHKTAGLVSNRFKLQLINPYGAGAPPAPPQTLDVNPHGSYTPLRTAGPQASSSSGGNGDRSALPFNHNHNAGPPGGFNGAGPGPNQGGNMGPGIPGNVGFHDHGSSSSSVEYGIPNHHHQNPHQHPSGQFMPHQQQHFSPGGAANSLFKLNPIPALANFFKRPASAASFDPMMQNGGLPSQGHAPPMNSFVHRPIGPESSSYRRERPSPASGSSKKAKKKGTVKKGKPQGK